MNFDFNIGAIVKLGIFGFATPLYKLGKVIEVTPTEVVIVPQLNVCRESDNGPSSFDEYCTADALHEVLHIRRQLIAYWTYAKAYDTTITDFISEADYSSLANISSKSFSDYTLNLYDKNTGICKGEGVKRSPYTPSPLLFKCNVFGGLFFFHINGNMILGTTYMPSTSSLINSESFIVTLRKFSIQ